LVEVVAKNYEGENFSILYQGFMNSGYARLWKEEEGQYKPCIKCGINPQKTIILAIHALET
jgi:hypothetical protein